DALELPRRGGAAWKEEMPGDVHFQRGIDVPADHGLVARQVHDAVVIPQNCPGGGFQDSDDTHRRPPLAASTLADMVRNVKTMTLGSAPGCTINSSSAHSAAIAARTSAMVALGPADAAAIPAPHQRSRSHSPCLRRIHTEVARKTGAVLCDAASTPCFGRGYVFAKSFA